MPSAWSNKDERKYERIKESEKERGASTERAEKIAARTVNKARRLEGRTPNKTSRGTGNPNRSLDNRSNQELYSRAKDLGVEGRSKMNKAQLAEAIRAKG